MDLEKLLHDLEKVQSAVYLGQTEAAKTIILAIMYEVKVAQQSVHWTGLTPLAAANASRWKAHWQKVRFRGR